MALKKTITIGESIGVPDAYIRITAMRIDHPNRVYVQVEIVEDKDSDSVLDTRTYDYSLKDDFGTKEDFNFKNAYLRLKQEKEWADAQDVFEEVK